MVTPAEKPWLKNYDPGVPQTLEFPSHPLQKFLEDSAEKYPDHPAIIFRGYKITYRQLNLLSDHVAAALHATGFRPGERAVIYMPNTPQFVIAYYGILKAGGIVVATNPLYTGRELEHQLKDCSAETIFVLSLYYNKFKKVQPHSSVKRVIVTNIKEYIPVHLQWLFTLLKEKKDGHYAKLEDVDMAWGDFLKLGTKAPRPRVQVKGEDIALLQYTGGTTGLSKGAIATHYNMAANVYMMKAWLTDIKEGGEVILTSIPLFHSYGMVTAMHLAMGSAGTLVLIPNPRDQKDVLQTIHKHKTTLFPGVPAMYNAINNNSEVLAGKYDLRSVRVCLSGSAPLLLETKEKFERLTGGKLVEGFGMTECHVATHCNPIFGRNVAGSVGLPLPGVECRIVDPNDPTRILGAGEIGELLLKSPTIMPAYWNVQGYGEDAFYDGWLKTGDIMEMDDEGYFYIRDRKKDMILSGGYNIYPRELEEVFATHPDVLDVAVIGIPHPKRGEEPMAYIVKKPGSTVTADEFIEWGKTQMAKYKYPRRVEFIAELPRSGAGKILKRELKILAAEATTL